MTEGTKYKVEQLNKMQIISETGNLLIHKLKKTGGFPLRISSVNVTKSAGNCGFGHIY